MSDVYLYESPFTLKRETVLIKYKRYLILRYYIISTTVTAMHKCVVIIKRSTIHLQI